MINNIKRCLYGYFKNTQKSPPNGHLKGSAVLAGVMVSAVIAGAVSLAVVRMSSSLYGSLNTANISVQAQSYAQSEAEKLRYCPYNQLADIAREDINGSDGYEREIYLSKETTSGSISERIATVNIYKEGEALPRSTLKVVRSTADLADDGVPVGTIVAWGGSNPSVVVDNGTWLLCDGRSFNANIFPKLAAALGTSNLPNLDGRFLEGNNAQPMRLKEAGLPNITGRIVQGNWGSVDFTEGAFYQNGDSGGPCANKGDWRAIAYFDASRSSPVYGKSNTVQPSSYTVRYYIKAK